MSRTIVAAPAHPPHRPEGLLIPDALWAALLEAYGSPGRAYHDTRHLLAVLERFAEAAREVGWEHPREVYLALLFHDAVYDPGADDNEERSAVLAAAWMQRVQLGSALDPAKVEHLVRLTARHGRLQPSDVTPEEALFLDCDLAILGAPADVFDRYEADVAREYASLPEELYVAGRRAFLQQLLGRERRFLSPYFHARLDPAARANLTRTLETHAADPV